MNRPTFIFNLLLVVAMLAGCQGQMVPVPPETQPTINPPVQMPAGLESFPQIAERSPDVEEDYEPVAENDTLRLYVKRETAAVLVEDKRDGRLWRSSPAGLAENTGTTANWRKQIELPVQVTYVGAERSQAKNIRPENGAFEYLPVENGLRTKYAFAKDDIAFDVIYRLNGDCLEAIIPDDSIVEGAASFLVDIDVLPFLGATQDGDDGYIIYPDGSGALMDFTSPHPQEVQRITSVVYGEDASGGLDVQSSIYTEEVVIPLFGLARDGAAFAGMITHGDFDATMNIARSGKGINYNHVWAQFLYRRQGRFSLTGGQPAWLYQPDRIGGDRQVRYCFLQGDQANYAGMAARYRTYLMEERGAKRLPENAPLMHVAFYLGTERRNWFLADMISMTTFDQAGDILDDLAADGIERLDVTLYAWNEGGTKGQYPKRMPVDDRLGGEDALRRLAQEVEARGQRLFLQDNYLLVVPGSPGVQPYLHAIRGVDGLPVGDSEQGFLLNPQVALRNFAARDLYAMTGLGADGLLLEAFADLTLPDKNTEYPLSREGFAASWMQVAAMSRQLFGAAAMEGSNAYALPHADRLDFVTVDSTHFDMFQETIPLYHIATHGLVQYSGQPYNLISDGKRMFLRHVEIGAMPSFIITEESSARLMRTGANMIYSSQYETWRDEIIRQYGVMETLAPLNNQFITGHRKLAADVYETVYEDGSRVIVNYSDTAYSDGAVNVPAQDFVLIGGN